MGKHVLVIEDWLRRIENLQARLKWSVAPTKIRTWLENFEEKDTEAAYDLLLLLEYISFEELQARFDELLFEIVKEVGDNTFILIVPYGKFGKSGPMMGYPIKNTNAYYEREAKNKMLLTWDFRSFKIKPETAVVFIDDFVGSGETFVEHYTTDINGIESLKKWADRTNIKKRYLMASIVMNQGKDLIKNKCGGEVRICAEFREKAFHPKLSVFNRIGNRSKVLSLAQQYGKNIGKGPLGYADTEALVAYAHTTPDNTLSIIWGDDRKWFPIYPRHARTRIDQARKLKKEVAFHIGVMNRMGLDLYDHDQSIVVDGKREIRYNHREDHSLLMYIKLKIERVENPLICQIIGITKRDLKEIIETGRKKGLINVIGEITPTGFEFFNSLTRKTNKLKFRSNNMDYYKPKNSRYLPKTFKGVT